MPRLPSDGGKIRPQALYEALADDLRRRILQPEFAAGRELEEAALVAHYGVSRTPLREALRLLCHEGLLVARPRCGVAVATINKETLAEAQALLALLRAHAAGADAARSPGPDVSIGEQLIRLLEQRVRLGQRQQGQGAARAARLAQKVGAQQA